MTNPVPKEKPESLSVWSEAQSFERTLREYELQKRRQRSVMLVDKEAAQLRLCLLELYEDLIIIDPVFATLKNVDDKIWALCFYNRIEELRGYIRKLQASQSSSLQSALDELQKHLDMGHSFYQTLILTMRSCSELDLISFGVAIYKGMYDRNDESTDEALQRKLALIGFIHKCTVFLGDLARYRELHSIEEVKDWETAQQFYRRAIKINPDIGKPYSQLAIIASYSKSELEVIYWYSLSLVNSVPHGVTKDNIIAFYKNRGKSTAEMELAKSPLHQGTIGILAFHSQVFSPEDSSTDELTSTYTAVIELVHTVLTTSSQGLPLPEWLKMVLPILIATYYDLDQRFDKTEQSAHRHRIRIVQVFVTAMIFNFLRMMLDMMVEHLAEADVAMESLAESEEVNSVFDYLAPIALACLWLERNMDVFVLFGNYATTFAEGQQILQPTLLPLFRSLASLSNIISSFADMDGSTECLPEDADLLGFLPLRAYYQQLDASSLREVLKGKKIPISEQMAVRAARIASCAKGLADDSRVDFFRFDENDGKFVLTDQESKKKEMRRLMKALAAERLKDQVSTLEQNIDELKRNTRPMVILDTDCYVHQLGAIKRWIMGGKCIIIVPMAIIDNLDHLKKGSDKVNAKAREAIRYLEQRFRYHSPALRAQKEGEHSIVWDQKGYMTHGSGLFVPKPLRSLIGCVDWYHREVAPQPMDEEDVAFGFVSEDDCVKEIVKECGVVVKGVKEWDKVLEERFVGGRFR